MHPSIGRVVRWALLAILFYCCIGSIMWYLGVGVKGLRGLVVYEVFCLVIIGWGFFITSRPIEVRHVSYYAAQRLADTQPTVKAPKPRAAPKPKLKSKPRKKT